MEEEMLKHCIQLRTVVLNTGPGSHAMPEQVVDFIAPLIQFQMRLKLQHGDRFAKGFLNLHRLEKYMLNIKIKMNIHLDFICY